MRLQHNNNDTGGPNLTPVIDVVFLLLIFFVCTARFHIPEEVLPSQLQPGSTAAAPVIREPEPLVEQIVIHVVNVNGRVVHRVNERQANSLDGLRRLLDTIAQIDESLPIILDIAGEVPFGDAIDVYDLCRLIGFQRIQLAAAADR